LPGRQWANVKINERMADQRIAVLVLGMHRSGTSLVTEVLSKLGVWIGAQADLIGPSEFNERGHFEFLPGVEFNNELLRISGGTWDNPPPPERIEALALLQKPPIEGLAVDHPLWAFKDPRLCLTLPVWRKALDNVDVRLLYILRDPLAVTHSLQRRNARMDIPRSHVPRGGMSVEYALNLWSEYNRRAALYIHRFALPHLVLWYDQLVDVPCTEVARLAEFIGCGQHDLQPAVGCVVQEFRHNGRSELCGAIGRG